MSLDITDHAIISVWEEHDQSTLSRPLGLTTADKLVNNTLGGVVEISKLGLPYHQGVRIGGGVSVLKSCQHNQ